MSEAHNTIGELPNFWSLSGLTLEGKLRIFDYLRGTPASLIIPGGSSENHAQFEGLKGLLSGPITIEGDAVSLSISTEGRVNTVLLPGLEQERIRIDGEPNSPSPLLQVIGEKNIFFEVPVKVPHGTVPRPKLVLTPLADNLAGLVNKMIRHLLTIRN